MARSEAERLRERAAQCRMLAHGAASPDVAEMLRNIALGFLARAEAEEAPGSPAIAMRDQRANAA